MYLILALLLGEIELENGLMQSVDIKSNTPTFLSIRVQPRDTVRYYVQQNLGTRFYVCTS